MANILKNSGSRLEKKKRTRLPLSVWLAFLLLVTLTVGSTLARYNTSVSGDTTARVAKFEMAAAPTAGQAEALTLNVDNSAASTGTYEFTVRNNSEVVVKYSVIVRGVPNGVTATMQIQGEVKNPTDNGDGSLTFADRELAIGRTDTCTLTFSTTENTPTGDNKSVTVQVYTEQVD